MNLRDLEYFEKIAELEHVGAAASVVHRTQPALTSCIRRLEEECGARLLERSGRGVKLTDAGRTLLKWARQLRLMVHDARLDIGQVGKGLSGTVSVGMAPTAAHTALPQVTAQLFEQAPEIQLQVTVGTVDSLTQLLESGGLDMMVATERPSAANIASVPVFDDQIVVVAAVDHPASEGVHSLPDLRAYRWIVEPSSTPTRKWLEDCFAQHQLPPLPVQMELNMGLAMVPMLLKGTQHLGFLSRRQLLTQQDALRELDVPSAVMHRRFALSRNIDRHLTPAAQRVWQYFSDLAKQSPSSTAG